MPGAVQHSQNGLVPVWHSGRQIQRLPIGFNKCAPLIGRPIAFQQVYRLAEPCHDEQSKQTLMFGQAESWQIF